MKFGVWCQRSAASICGAAGAWLKENGEIRSFDLMEEAEAHARVLNARTVSMNVYYSAKQMHCEVGNGR